MYFQCRCVASKALPFVPDQEHQGYLLGSLRTSIQARLNRCVGVQRERKFQLDCGERAYWESSRELPAKPGIQTVPRPLPRGVECTLSISITRLLAHVGRARHAHTSSEGLCQSLFAHMSLQASF